MKRGLLTLLAIALALTCALPVQAAKRRVPHGFYGVMWNRAAMAAPKTAHGSEFYVMARSGVESVRTVFSWSQAQPDPGLAPTFDETDRVTALAAVRHIELLPVVIYTPTWAANNPGFQGSTPKNPADYAYYLTALVGRYGPRGSFWTEHPELPRVPIRHWQIWNEPHLTDYWKVAPGEFWATGYTRLLKAAYAAVKRADPHATVVTAGLASFPWRYLSAIYKAGGKNAFDAVAINFFTGSPKNVIRGVRVTHRVLRHHGQKGKKVWITEGTWPASKGHAPGHVRASWQLKWETTPAGMAKRLRELYRLAVAQRRRAGIGRLYWYTWATKYTGDDLFDYDGLMRWDGGAFNATPALSAYTASARANQGCRKNGGGLCRP